MVRPGGSRGAHPKSLSRTTTWAETRLGLQFAVAKFHQRKIAEEIPFCFQLLCPDGKGCDKKEGFAPSLQRFRSPSEVYSDWRDKRMCPLYATRQKVWPADYPSFRYEFTSHSSFSPPSRNAQPACTSPNASHRMNKRNVRRSRWRLVYTAMCALLPISTPIYVVCLRNILESPFLPPTPLRAAIAPSRPLFCRLGADEVYHSPNIQTLNQWAVKRTAYARNILHIVGISAPIPTDGRRHRSKNQKW